MIYKYSDIKTVHLEVTSRCNASCPMCGRNKFGGPENENLPISDLSLRDVQQILPIDLVKNLKRLYMCGNYGDPIVAEDTIEILLWLRQVNPDIRLGLHTNGSARTTVWWQQLGGILNQPWDYVKWGLDGLVDTNAIYRRGTNWNKIMDNAKAFISSGGRAHWEYIVFKHNEHQIDQARSLSEQLGFVQFRIKKTGRFFSNTKLEIKDSQEVWSRDGQVEYLIERPTNADHYNDSLASERSLVSRYGSMQAYLDSNRVTCKVREDMSIYISAEGLAFPCCWTANQLYVWYWNKGQSEIWTLLDHETDNVNALKIALKDIIEGPYFKRISDSWSLPRIADGKLRVCAKTCGAEFDQFNSQFDSTVNIQT